MRKLKLMVGVLLLSALVLAACGSGSAADNIMTENAGDNMGADAMNAENDMAENDGEMMEDEMSNDPHDAMDDSMEEDDAMMEDEDDPMMEEETDAGPGTMEEVMTPPWFDHQFTDAVSGETFTINGFRGKVVLLETMAMWCSNCMRQQQQVRELHNLLGEREDFVGIGIDVDLNEEIGRLATYTQDNNFHWYYSVANQEVLTGISETLGGQFLNPPSTPIVIIDKDGNMHPLPFGIKSADELLSAVEMYFN